jgi:serine/threonine-protein kinase RsbW
MSEPKSTSVEVRLPTKMGYEKVAMSTASAVAKLMGFPEDRIEDLKTARRGSSRRYRHSGSQGDG